MESVIIFLQLYKILPVGNFVKLFQYFKFSSKILQKTSSHFSNLINTNKFSGPIPKKNRRTETSFLYDVVPMKDAKEDQEKIILKLNTDD